VLVTGQSGTNSNWGQQLTTVTAIISDGRQQPGGNSQITATVSDQPLISIDSNHW